MKFREQIKKISDNNQNSQSFPNWQDQDGRKSDLSIYAKVALIDFTDRRLYHSLATLSRGKCSKEKVGEVCKHTQLSHTFEKNSTTHIVK